LSKFQQKDNKSLVPDNHLIGQFCNPIKLGDEFIIKADLQVSVDDLCVEIIEKLVIIINFKLIFFTVEIGDCYKPIVIIINDKNIVTFPTREAIVAIVIFEIIFTRTADQGVIAIVTVELVIALTTVELIISLMTLQGVVTIEASNLVVAILTFKFVVFIGTVERVVTAPANKQRCFTTLSRVLFSLG